MSDTNNCGLKSKMQNKIEHIFITLVVILPWILLPILIYYLLFMDKGSGGECISDYMGGVICY